MIKFRDNLYLSPSIKKVNRIKWKIRTGRGQFNVFLLVFNHDNCKLEYFHNAMLKQKSLWRMDYDVVGLAMSEEECIAITSDILNEAYARFGEYDIGKYLE